MIKVEKIVLQSVIGLGIIGVVIAHNPHLAKKIDIWFDQWADGPTNGESQNSSPKHDIFGFYPGMSVAKFVALAQNNPMSCETPKLEQKTNGVIYSCAGTPNELLGIQFDKTKKKVLEIGYDYSQKNDIDTVLQQIVNKFGEGVLLQWKEVQINYPGVLGPMAAVMGRKDYEANADLSEGYKLKVTAGGTSGDFDVEILLSNDSISVEHNPLPAKF